MRIEIIFISCLVYSIHCIMTLYMPGSSRCLRFINSFWHSSLITYNQKYCMNDVIHFWSASMYMKCYTTTRPILWNVASVLHRNGMKTSFTNRKVNTVWDKSVVPVDYWTIPLLPGPASSYYTDCAGPVPYNPVQFAWNLLMLTHQSAVSQCQQCTGVLQSS
jgi:hypothetical protein